ncbi:hypothetical protein BJX62DRAFT_60955 [Aspergillus germanicus]
MLVPGSGCFSSNCEDQSIPTIAQPSALEGVPASGFGQADFISSITGWSNDPWHCGDQGIAHLLHLDTNTAPYSYIGSTNAQFGCSDWGNTSYDASLLPPAVQNPPSHPACPYITDYMADLHGDLNSTSAFAYTAPLSVMNSTVIPSGPSSQFSSVREHAGDRDGRSSLRTLLPVPTERQLLECHEGSQQKPSPFPMCPAGYERRNARTRHYKKYHNPDAEPGTGGRPRISSRLL